MTRIIKWEVEPTKKCVINKFMSVVENVFRKVC